MSVIYTGRVQQHRVYLNLGYVFIDTTVKSGNKLFAPTWDMVMGHKDGTISDEEYLARYRPMMTLSYNNNKQMWVDILTSNAPLVLCCYCKHGVFCHRHSLYSYFQHVANHLKLDVTFPGELIT